VTVKDRSNGYDMNGAPQPAEASAIGIVGLGKLGLPVAAAIGQTQQVVAYDIRPEAMRAPTPPQREEGLVEAWPTARVEFGSLSDVVARCELIFVAVQTPHEPLYEGATRIPDERADFDYTYLCAAVEAVADEVARLGRPRTVSIISTVLPGTVGKYIAPLCGPLVTLAYNPFFVAMGTTIRDFLEPEFVLLGGDPDGTVERFYGALTDAPVYRTSIENAELIKVSYNTFIGLKLAFANTLMEICHKSPGCDVDEVTGALKLAHRRLISPAYLSGGMGDGGACHPRDNIALSWLARELDLSYDLFESAMFARERQAEWLVDLICEHDLPPAILGVAFKAGTDLVTGSPAVLCQRLLKERGRDPVVYDQRCGLTPKIDGPHVFLVGARHPEHPDYPFPPGSVVIDPWRYIEPRDGVTVIPVGRGPAGQGRFRREPRETATASG
jgi:UDPglucose 6-dehydrogenase